MTVPELAHETNTRVFEGESGMTRIRNIVEVHSKAYRLLHNNGWESSFLI
jgi:hypothetical protein